MRGTAATEENVHEFVSFASKVPYRNDDCIQLAQQQGIKRTNAYAFVRRVAENGGKVSKPRGGFRGKRMNPNTCICWIWPFRF